MTRQKLAVSVAQAFAQVQEAFSSRRKPLGIAYCSTCYQEEEITHFLSLPYERLTANDLRPIFWDAYVCWGTWPQVAYYVPRILQLYAEDVLAGFEENVFAKLLLAVRPQLAGKSLVPDVGVMSEPERQSVSGFVQAVLEARLRAEAEHSRVYILTEALSFLVAFDTSLASFLDTLRYSESSSVCANVCALMADCMWQPREFGNSWLEHYSVLPENAIALASFLDPTLIAAYLLEHTADVQRFDAETQERINYAFDWAMSQASAGNKAN